MMKFFSRNLEQNKVIHHFIMTFCICSHICVCACVWMHALVPQSSPLRAHAYVSLLQFISTFSAAVSKQAWTQLHQTRLSTASLRSKLDAARLTAASNNWASKKAKQQKQSKALILNTQACTGKDERPNKGSGVKFQTKLCFTWFGYLEASPFAL